MMAEIEINGVNGTIPSPYPFTINLGIQHIDATKKDIKKIKIAFCISTNPPTKAKYSTSPIPIDFVK